MSAGAYGGGNYGDGLYSLAYTEIISSVAAQVALNGGFNKSLGVSSHLDVQCSIDAPNASVLKYLGADTTLVVEAYDGYLTVGAGRNLAASLTVEALDEAAVGVSRAMSASDFFTAPLYGDAGVSRGMRSNAVVSIAVAPETLVVEYMWGPVNVPNGGWSAVSVNSAGWNPVVPLN